VRPRRLALPGVLVVAVAFLAAGCAIPTQSAPSTMPPSKVPFALLDPHLPTTTTTTAAGIVTVNMNAAFGAITGSSIELAVAQIVATVSAEVGLNSGVIFEIEGQRTSVPIANGSQVSEPVYLIEFLSVAP
jgi:hypothetical protein